MELWKVEGLWSVLPLLQQALTYLNAEQQAHWLLMQKEINHLCNVIKMSLYQIIKPAQSRVSSQKCVFISFYSCYTFMSNKALKNYYPPGSSIYSTHQIVHDTVVLFCHRSPSASAHVTSWHLSPGCSRGSVCWINGPKFMVPLCESYRKWLTWPLGLVSLYRFGLKHWKDISKTFLLVCFMVWIKALPFWGVASHDLK